jgi:predicted ATPase/class 3 adenylate cyclase
MKATLANTSVLPTGTVTFLFTDIEGSTRLLQELGDEWDDVLEDQRRLLRAAITANHGLELATEGDSFFVVFSSAADATQAVVLAQQALDAYAWPGDTSVRVRMGLHTGEGRIVSADYVGLDVHRAARIAECGHGGQVIISASVHALVEKALPPGVRIRDLGEHRLKDLLRPEHLYQLDIEGLPTEFPALKTLDVRRNNLPLQLTSFIGRVREKLEVKRLLSQDRLVTITGVGGVGKTRLAVEIAHELVAGFKDGVWLTELAPVTDGGLVARTVASALGLREQPGRRLEDVMLAYLEGRQILLVIDNCEHLLQAVAELVETLLLHCADVRVLATSRESLRVAGETAWPLPPLGVPTPDAGETLEVGIQSEAVRLFHERAAAASFVPSPENIGWVVEICRRLDGLPLGIELAAGTLRTLHVRQVAANLDDRFRTLAAGHRTALRRQQTLETSIDWSYELLSDPERTLFRRLAVFSGNFGVEHVKEICSAPPVDFDDTFRLLSSLVVKSLVTFDSSGQAARYGMLETVHQYAQERLARSGEDDRTRDRHLEWYVSFAEQAALAIHGRDQANWFQLLDDEYSNLRQALKWASEKRSEAMARLARALTFFWEVRGYLTEGRQWLRLALDIPTDPLLRARTLTWAGLLACIQSDSTSLRTLLAEARQLLEKLDDPATMGLALKLLGWDYWSAGQTLEGLGFLERGVAIARKAAPSWELATNLNDLGFFSHVSGDKSLQPRILLEEALGMARELEDAWACGLTLDSLAQVAADSGDYDTAHACWQECITIAIHLKDRFALPSFLEGFARLALAKGQYALSMRLIAAASRLNSDTGVIRPQPEWERSKRMVQAIREALGDGESDLAWHEGQSMTLTDAIEQATGSPRQLATEPSLVPLVL